MNIAAQLDFLFAVICVYVRSIVYCWMCYLAKDSFRVKPCSICRFLLFLSLHTLLCNSYLFIFLLCNNINNIQPLCTLFFAFIFAALKLKHRLACNDVLAVQVLLLHFMLMMKEWVCVCKYALKGKCHAPNKRMKMDAIKYAERFKFSYEHYYVNWPFNTGDCVYRSNIALAPPLTHTHTRTTDFYVRHVATHAKVMSANKITIFK